MNAWTKAEIEYLKANYGRQNARQIGKHIGRSQYAVHTMRKRLGLTMTNDQRSVACSVQHVNQQGHRNHNWKGGVSRNHARYTGRYKIANPQKVRAHIAVYAAVKRGQISRKPCEVCGEIKAQAHHDDYSKPLTVRWLCKPHHIEADNARRAKESDMDATMIPKLKDLHSKVEAGLTLEKEQMLMDLMGEDAWEAFQEIGDILNPTTEPVAA